MSAFKALAGDTLQIKPLTNRVYFLYQEVPDTIWLKKRPKKIPKRESIMN